MFEAMRKDFTDWKVQGQHKVVNGFDVIICKETNRQFHIDKDTLEEV